MQRQEDSWIVKGKAIAKGKTTKKVEKTLEEHSWKMGKQLEKMNNSCKGWKTVGIVGKE